MTLLTLFCFGVAAMFVIRWAVHGAANRGVGRKRKR